jgi:hypothetical protein
VVEPVDGEHDRDAEGAEDLDVDAELGDPAHDLRAGDVQGRLDGKQDQHHDQDRDVAGGVEVPVEPVVHERGEVDDHPGVYRSDRDQQRDPVEPAHEPAVSAADVVLAVLVQRPGDRIMAGQFAEDERNQQHAPDREPERPDVARAGDAEPDREQREDTDDGR